MIRSWRDRLRELEREEQQAQAAAANGDASGGDTIREVEAVTQPVRQPAPVRAPTLSGPTPHEDGQRRAPSIEAPLFQHAATSPEVRCSTSPVLSRKGHLEPAGVERLMRPIDQALTNNRAPAYRYATTTGTATPFCSCDALLANGQWSLPLRRQADELVRVYFTRVHRMYPIIHQPTFMRQYQRLWDPADHNPANCSGLCRKKNLHKAFPALVNAVFAMASLFGPHSPEHNSARATAFFNKTQKLDLLDIIDEEVGIELVQLLLLMGFYLQSTEKFSKCWNITGLAIRMAQNMGLQLSVQEAKTRGLLASQPTQLECEMRLRVWYGCVLLDREISMSFGRPLMITNSSSERLGLPHAIDDEYLSDRPGAEWGSQPPGQHSMLESYIQTIKLYDILGQVLDREEWRDGPAFSRVAPADLGSAPDNVGANTQSMLDLDTLIMEWMDSLPEYLRYDPSPENDRRRDGAGDLTPANEIPPTDFSAQAKRLHARYDSDADPFDSGCRSDVDNVF